jgi:hypothetical protein
MKTPAANVARKLLNKVTSHTEGQPVRAKPRPPPPPALLQSSPPPPPYQVAVLPIHPPACTGDQSLDFSLLHTMKNVYGQVKVRKAIKMIEKKYNLIVKVMTSTPNSSFMPMENHNGKTAHNTIGQRKSKRRSKRTPLPLLVSFICLLKYVMKCLFLDGSRYRRRNNSVLVICYNYSCTFFFLFFTLCLSVYIYSK